MPTEKESVTPPQPEQHTGDPPLRSPLKPLLLMLLLLGALLLFGALDS